MFSFIIHDNITSYLYRFAIYVFRIQAFHRKAQSIATPPATDAASFHATSVEHIYVYVYDEG